MTESVLELDIQSGRVVNLLAESIAGEPQIPLDRAALCLDCETITLNSCHECPACGSAQLSMLQRFVDGAG